MLIKNYKRIKGITAVFIIAVISAALFPAFSVRVEATGTIADGVYTLQNKSTGKYLDIQNDSPDVNMYIQQYDYGSAPSSNETRSGLFKFKHIGSDNYLIRTMRNNGNTFYRVSDTAVKTTEADPVDNNNDISLSWHLTSAGGGYYYIKDYTTGKCLCAPPSNVNNGKYCTTETYSPTEERQKWLLEEYEGDVIKGIAFKSHITSVYMESETQYNAYMWTTDMSNNGPIVWGVHNSTSWNLPCSATITSTGVLHTYAVSEHVDVSASANLGTAWYFEVTVNPPLESGLYAIQSCVCNNLYIDIRGDSFKKDALMQQYKYLLSNPAIPSQEEYRSLLYKVEWTGTGNAYVIRTMTNNANGFKAEASSLNSNLKTCKINASNTGIWHIKRFETNNGPQFIIKWNDDATPLVIGAVANGENEYISRTYLELMYDNGINSRWSFVSPGNVSFGHCKVNYLKPHIVDMESSIYLSSNDFEETYYYNTDMAVNTIGALTNFSVKNPGDLSCTSNVAENSNGYLTGKTGKAGMVSVIAQFGNVYSEPFNIYFKPTSGEYFLLQNIEGTLGCVESNGTYSAKTTFDYNDMQIWKRTPISSGASLYYIQDMNGNYLTVPSSAVSGSALELYPSVMTAPNNFRQIWRFDNGNSANGKRIHTLYATNLWLNIDSSDILTLGSYSSDDVYNDEFNVVLFGEDVVYLRTFEFFPPLDISAEIKYLYNHYNGFELVYMQNHLGNNNTNNDPNACYRIALDMLENSKVAIVAGHADSTKITISQYNNHYSLKSEDMYELSTPKVDLSDVDIVIFDGCNTAGTPATGYNLPDSAARAGAKVAIGWKESQPANRPADWIERFLFYMNKEDVVYTAADAVDLANHDIIPDPTEYADIYGTDTSFSFN